MHVHGTPAQQTDGHRASRQARTPDTLAGRMLRLSARAGNRAVSRALEEGPHAHGPGCGHGEVSGARTSGAEMSGAQAAVQRKASLEAGIASPSRPLESRIRDRAEQVYPMTFGHVQWHDGPVAQRAAREFGAQALTVGSHILAAEPNLPDEVKFHEVDHTYQTAMGDVAGTADGSGTKVSSPHDPFEVSAASNGKKVAQGGSPDLSLPGRPAPVQRSTDDLNAAPRGTDDLRAVQRFAVVRPGETGYPQRGRESPGGTRTPVGDFFDKSGDDFFPGQEMKSRTVNKPNETVEKESFVDASGAPNIVYQGLVALRISDNMDLAVEHTGSGRQAKMFFATDDQIGRANERLHGQVRLERSGSHYLSITHGETTRTLWRVHPVVTRKSNPEGPGVRGLPATLPQRCNEIATAVSGQEGLADHGTDAYFAALAGVLADVQSKLKLKKAPTYEDYLKAKKGATSREPEKVQKYSKVMERLIVGVLSHRGEERLEEAIQRRGLNEHTPPAGIGDVLMTKTQAPTRDAPGVFDFHFAPVVASSGSDSVTMENYARHEEARPGNDPQWYFAMHGKEQSFHEQWGHLDHEGRVRLTILMKGA
ncbi:DUF4157 domain-containing protein [Streptomyces sp. NPDC059009]|uniref:eCIS core domain-containing protein n=1 Tax=Streptomyces sp. NPDC059009 TaxID=3346694 RepID=UPI0036B50D6C